MLSSIERAARALEETLEETLSLSSTTPPPTTSSSETLPSITTTTPSDSILLSLRASLRRGRPSSPVITTVPPISSSPKVKLEERVEIDGITEVTSRVDSSIVVEVVEPILDDKVISETLVESNSTESVAEEIVEIQSEEIVESEQEKNLIQENGNDEIKQEPEKVTITSIIDLIPDETTIEVVKEEPIVVIEDKKDEKVELVEEGKLEIVEEVKIIDSNVDVKVSDLEKLQSLKVIQLNRIINENFDGLSGVDDVVSFEKELVKMKFQSELSTKEVTKLSSQLKHQSSQIEELRETHLLESKSQSNTISTLTNQLNTASTSTNLLKSQFDKSNESTKSLQIALVKSGEEMEKVKLVAKEEEEKKGKALSLLRALRQKLIKSEKDKEQVEKERDLLKLNQVGHQDLIKADRTRYDQELVSLKSDQELELSRMKSVYEREGLNKKSQFELEVINIRAALAKDITTKESRVKDLELIVKEISKERDLLFDELQMKSAELESILEHQELIQIQSEELRYELKSVKDELCCNLDQVEELRLSKMDRNRNELNHRRLLDESEKRHELIIKDMKLNQIGLEKDRLELEIEMSSKLTARLKELERLKLQIKENYINYNESIQTTKEKDEKLSSLERVSKDSDEKITRLENSLEELRIELKNSTRTQAGVREELKDRAQRSTDLEIRLEEFQLKDSNLRSNNKILRDEIRKLQSSLSLPETQRNKGVGYFSSFSINNNNDRSNSLTLSSPNGSEDGRGNSIVSHQSPKFSTPQKRNDSVTSEKEGGVIEGDEALNFEYLRNVLLEFLEKPNMRPQLLGVMGIILHFSPSELRKLSFLVSK